MARRRDDGKVRRLANRNTESQLFSDIPACARAPLRNYKRAYYSVVVLRRFLPLLTRLTGMKCQAHRYNYDNIDIIIIIMELLRFRARYFKARKIKAVEGH
jgi:hypothetical protein